MKTCRLVKDKIVMVTGASSGIGVETARELARQGATVLIAGRNPERTHAVRDMLREDTRNESIEAFIADFSSLKAVKGLAEEVSARFDRLDVLINNAGLWHSKFTLSADGYEDTFAVNHLAGYLLTEELLPLLREAKSARIVHVASRLHKSPRTLDLNNLMCEKTRFYRGLKVYGHSKLAQVIYSTDLARRLEGTNVTSNALHPGDVMTNVTRDNRFLNWAKNFAGFILITPEEGAKTSLHVAMHPSVEGVSGRYFDKSKIAKAHRHAANRKLAEGLRERSEALIKRALER